MEQKLLISWLKSNRKTIKFAFKVSSYFKNLFLHFICHILYLGSFTLSRLSPSHSMCVCVLNNRIWINTSTIMSWKQCFQKENIDQFWFLNQTKKKKRKNYPSGSITNCGVSFSDLMGTICVCVSVCKHQQPILNQF